MKIQITTEDIAKGLSASTKCPVALAAKRAGLEDPAVCWTHIAWGPKTERKYAVLPTVASNFVKNYDLCLKDDYPFEFDLDLENTV